MTAADGIRKHGFRRWYERQLIEYHAWFVTCFLCMIVVAALLESLNLRSPGTGSLTAAAITFSAVILGVVAWRRYMVILDRAEWVAEQSNCPACGYYGSLAVEAAGFDTMAAAEKRTATRAESGTAWIRVRCRKCGHEWTID